MDAHEPEAGLDGAGAVSMDGKSKIVESLRPREPGAVVGPESAGEDDAPERR